MRPTPAAARYIAAGEPSPPAPIHKTLPAFSLRCPSTPTSGMIRWRLYRLISSLVSCGSSFSVMTLTVVSPSKARYRRTRAKSSGLRTKLDASRHRRDDADGIARRHRRLLLLQVADVL